MKHLTNREKEIILKQLVSCYNQSKKRSSFCNIIKNNDRRIEHDVRYVQYIDAMIDYCTPESQKILKNEYFEPVVKVWSNEYYSRSTWYRLKKKAVEEFIDCLEF